jgi:glycosyltransferase involved in cell wall biosynthesis
MLFVQITQDYFSHGAVMRRARQETRALLKAGHEVIAITDLRHLSEFDYFNDLDKKPMIIPLNPIFIHRPFRKVSSQLTFAFRVFFALRKLSKSKEIDFIISHSSTVCLAVHQFCKKRKINNAWVIQDLIRDRMATGNPYNWIETQMLKFSDPYALKNMKFLLPVSKYTKKLAIVDGANPENTYIKYNTVDTKSFSPIENIKKDIDILFFGRLSVEKGVDLLLKATKYLEKKRKIVIIGDGPLAYILKSNAKLIDQNIEFWGFIDHSKLPSIIPRAKIVVCPSRSECHAAVPIEAMACGVPVIASRVAGMEDTIEDKKNGWLLEENEPKKIATLLSEILSNPKKLRITSEKAQERAELFSLENFDNKIVKFYESLAKK